MSTNDEGVNEGERSGKSKQFGASPSDANVSAVNIRF